MCSAKLLAKFLWKRSPGLSVHNCSKVSHSCHWPFECGCWEIFTVFSVAILMGFAPYSCIALYMKWFHSKVLIGGMLLLWSGMILGVAMTMSNPLFRSKLVICKWPMSNQNTTKQNLSKIPGKNYTRTAPRHPKRPNQLTTELNPSLAPPPMHHRPRRRSPGRRDVESPAAAGTNEHGLGGRMGRESARLLGMSKVSQQPKTCFCTIKYLKSLQNKQGHTLSNDLVSRIKHLSNVQ